VHKLPKVKCEMSYHARLAFAKKWVDSKDPRYLEGAIRILEQLREDHPHVLEIKDELALAYLEANQPQNFERLLAAVNARYGQLSEEFLSRIGRFWKDQGDNVRATAPKNALSSYEKALDWYQKAFAIRANYYPGINVAGLQFILGKTEQAKQTAEAVLGSLEGPQRPEELPWIRATQADAQLILGNDNQAENLYRQAVAQADPRGRAAMRRQVELLLAYAPATSSMGSYWTPSKLDTVFGP
jgi:tetratricopeptide (TPR) repeat protein